MCYKMALALAFTGGLVLTTALPAESKQREAPADEYFGRFKMSILEITNRIKDAERGSPGYGGLLNTQAALEDWAHKYPADPWLPSREFRLWRLFSGFHSPDADAEAQHCRSFFHSHWRSHLIP